jgi:anaerobic selenocysteine-containing dehydrogenase
MAARTAAPYVEINAADAQTLKIADGDLVQVTVGASQVQARAHVNGAAPAGTVLLPRHLSGTATPLAVAPGEVRKV